MIERDPQRLDIDRTEQDAPVPMHFRIGDEIHGSRLSTLRADPEGRARWHEEGFLIDDDAKNSVRYGKLGATLYILDGDGAIISPGFHSLITLADRFAVADYCGRYMLLLPTNIKPTSDELVIVAPVNGVRVVEGHMNPSRFSFNGIMPGGFSTRHNLKAWQLFSLEDEAEINEVIEPDSETQSVDPAGDLFNLRPEVMSDEQKQLRHAHRQVLDFAKRLDLGRSQSRPPQIFGSSKMPLVAVLGGNPKGDEIDEKIISLPKVTIPDSPDYQRGIRIIEKGNGEVVVELTLLYKDGLSVEGSGFSLAKSPDGDVVLTPHDSAIIDVQQGSAEYKNMCNAANEIVTNYLKAARRSRGPRLAGRLEVRRLID